MTYIDSKEKSRNESEIKKTGFIIIYTIVIPTYHLCFYPSRKNATSAFSHVHERNAENRLVKCHRSYPYQILARISEKEKY